MKNLQFLMDRAAMGFSILCMIHCVGTPLILALLPAFGSIFLSDERFHQALVLAVIPLSIITLIMSCRRHGKWLILACGFLGLVVLGATALWGHELLGETGEKIATIIGATIILYSHAKNYKLCNKNSCHTT